MDALYNKNKTYTSDEFFAMKLNGTHELIDGKIYPRYDEDDDLEKPMFDGKTFTLKEFEDLNLPYPCELIGGKIYSMSPSPNVKHQDIVLGLFCEIRYYISKHKGKCKALTGDVNINGKETVIPDVFVTCSPENFDEQQYNGAPDWIIEVLSPGSQKRDLNYKYDIYKDAGVKEYWIIDPEREKVRVFLFNTNNMGYFTFNDEITPDLYKNNPEPLIIKINDLL